MSTTGEQLGSYLAVAMLGVPIEEVPPAQLAAWKKFGNQFVDCLKISNPDEGFLMKANADGWPVKDSSGSTHARQHALNSTSDHTSSINATYAMVADANGLPSQGTNTDTQIAAAVTASHARQHAIDSATDHTGYATQTNSGTGIVAIGITAPATPTTNDLWIDTN